MPAAIYGTFKYGVVALYGEGAAPALLTAQAISRRTIELVFAIPVKVRDLGTVVAAPSDPFTPVDWVGGGGNASDAANPANYSMTRPVGGVASGPGEAVDLVPTWARSNPDTETESAGGYYSDRIWVEADYHHSARAGYELSASNLITTAATPMVPTTKAFLGYVASQVDRQSLHLIETLPGIVRRMDDEGTGDLAKFFTAIQEVFDRMTEDVDAFFPDLCEIDRMRPEFLDILLYDLGDPLGGLFDLTTNEKRKLASVLVQMYREKGTCEGIVNVVRLFTGLTMAGCTRAWADTWRLDTGSYPATIGDNDELGIDTILGPGTDVELWSFWLTHVAPGALTADQVAKIAAIVEYMKPAGTRYLGITTP